MRILGGIIGALVGWCFGRSFGAIVGWVVGSLWGAAAERQQRLERQSGIRANTARIFCETAAAVLGKMAKADGRVTQDEIRVVESAFARFGFSGAARDIAVRAFNRAKDDSKSIYEYAERFASTVLNPEVRVLFYAFLWDLACADGKLTPGEDAILKRIPISLGVPVGYYDIFRRECLRAKSAGAPTREDELADAYRQLGVAPGASDAEVKKAYRQMAKKYHPDSLRANGLPDEMLKKATERMSKINAAWARIKEARKL